MSDISGPSSSSTRQNPQVQVQDSDYSALGNPEVRISWSAAGEGNDQLYTERQPQSPLSPTGQMLPASIVEEEEEDDDDYQSTVAPATNEDIEPSLPRIPSVRFADEIQSADIGQDEPVETASGAPPRPLSLQTLQTPGKEIRPTASHLTPHPSANQRSFGPNEASSGGPSASLRAHAAAEAAARQPNFGERSADRGSGSKRAFGEQPAGLGSSENSGSRLATRSDDPAEEDLPRFPLKRDVWRAPNARREASALGGPSFGTRRSQATAQEYSERRTTELARVFALLDDDADGLLDVDQLRIFVAASGFAPTPQFLQRVIDRTPRRWAHKGVDFDTAVAALETRAEDEALTEDDLAHLLKVSCGAAWSTGSARQAMKAEGDAERQAVHLAATERDGSQGTNRQGVAAGARSTAVRSKIRNGGLSRCVATAEHARRLLCGIETRVQSRLTPAEADTLLRSAGAYAVAAEAGQEEPAVDVLDFTSWLSGGFTRHVRSGVPELSYQMSEAVEQAREHRLRVQREGGSGAAGSSSSGRGEGKGGGSSPLVFKVGGAAPAARGSAAGKGVPSKPASALARLTASSFDADRVAATSSDDFLQRAAEFEARAESLGN